MEMTIEMLQLKLENQSKLIKELTNENEELFHQYNHLMIRNGKMLKRVDDLQKIIDDLHVRIEELQLINGNMMQINDRLRTRSDSRFSANNNQTISPERMSLRVRKRSLICIMFPLINCNSSIRTCKSSIIF